MEGNRKARRPNQTRLCIVKKRIHIYLKMYYVRKVQYV